MKKITIIGEQSYLLTNKETVALLSAVDAKAKFYSCERLETMISIAGIKIIETPRNDFGREVFVHLDKEGIVSKCFRTKTGKFYYLSPDGTTVEVGKDKDTGEYYPHFIDNLYPQDSYWDGVEIGILPEKYENKLLK